MEALFDKLNNTIVYKRLDELQKNHRYTCSYFYMSDTKFGRKCFVVLNNSYKVILPDRYSKLITESDMQVLNSGKVNFEYMGLVELGSGHTYHKCKFSE